MRTNNCRIIQVHSLTLNNDVLCFRRCILIFIPFRMYNIYFLSLAEIRSRASRALQDVARQFSNLSAREQGYASLANHILGGAQSSRNSKCAQSTSKILVDFSQHNFLDGQRDNSKTMRWIFLKFGYLTENNISRGTDEQNFQILAAKWVRSKKGIFWHKIANFWSREAKLKNLSRQSIWKFCFITSLKIS